MEVKQYNVIITGPDGAGKTTAVQSVSDNGKASSEMFGVCQWIMAW